MLMKVDIEELFLESKDYGRIQDNKVQLDPLLDLYCSGDLSDPFYAGEQAEYIQECRTKKDLQSKLVVFHELHEMQSYFDFGYSAEDIKSKKAYNESYLEVHRLAEKAHLQLCQSLSKKVYGNKLPLPIIFITQPYIEIFDPLLRRAKEHFIKFYPEEDVLNLKVDDVGRSISMFEQFGSEYQSKDFKENCENFVKEISNQDMT